MKLLNTILIGLALVGVLGACTALIQTDKALTAHKELYNRKPAIVKQ